MKAEILKENFKKALNVCERVSRKALSLPVLQNILIKTSGSFLELTTTNLETTIRWSVLAKIEEQGVVAVPAGFLTNLINLTKAEKIILESDNQNLILKSDNQKVQIQGQNPEDFPIIPKQEKNNFLTISSSRISAGLQQISDIPSTSQIRPEISGIYFNSKKDILKTVATDSFRLGEKTVKLDSGAKKDVVFILPQQTARELINIASQQQGAVNIYTSPNQVLFEFLSQEPTQEKIQVMSRLIEGQYPNYQEIIPKKPTTRVQINKEELENQVKKAGLFSGKMLEVKISAIPNQGKIKITSKSSETGKSELFSDCNIEGEPVEVAFNYRFLLDGISSLKSSEVALELSGNEGAGMLKPVGDSSYLYILMPIKAN